MQRVFWKSLVVAAALMAGGCDNDVGITPTEPPPTTTDTFTGTINMNGATTHTFGVTAAGTVTVTLAAVAPDSATVVGLSLGTWNASSTACALTITKDDALQGQILTGNASGPGTLCVRVADTATRLTGPVDYTVTVVHP